MAVVWTDSEANLSRSGLTTTFVRRRQNPFSHKSTFTSFLSNIQVDFYQGEVTLLTVTVTKDQITSVSLYLIVYKKLEVKKKDIGNRLFYF